MSGEAAFPVNYYGAPRVNIRDRCLRSHRRIYLVPRRPSAPDAESAFWVGRLAPRCDFLVRMLNFIYILHTNYVAI